MILIFMEDVMSKFKDYLLLETSYTGNLGFMEMVQLYQKASMKELEELEEIIKREDWEKYKNLVHKILGVKLK